jgi:hypothetical protein
VEQGRGHDRDSLVTSTGLAWRRLYAAAKALRRHRSRAGSDGGGGAPLEMKKMERRHIL